MNLPRVILKKQTKVDEFKIHFNEVSNRVIDPALEKKVDYYWEKLKNECKEKGLELWDGTYYRLENVKEIMSGKTALEFSTVKYSTLKAYSQISKEVELEENQFTNFVSTGGIIKTNDGFFVFGKRGNNTHSSNVDIIGGGLCKNEIIVNSGNDIQRNIIKEMNEELHIKESDIKKCDFLGILQSVTTNILFIFDIELNLNKGNLLKKFTERIDNEMAELIFIEEKDLESYLKSLPSYRPLLWDLLS